jgi:hypothetical protein
VYCRQCLNVNEDASESIHGSSSSLSAAKTQPKRPLEACRLQMPEGSAERK